MDELMKWFYANYEKAGPGCLGQAQTAFDVIAQSQDCVPKDLRAYDACVMVSQTIDDIHEYALWCKRSNTWN